MSIQKEIVLRFHARGHVRFDVPRALCAADVADALVSRLSQIEGVRHVDLYLHRCKLSIRYSEAVCDFPKLAGQLSDLIDGLQTRNGMEPKGAQGHGSTLKEKVSQAGPIRWVREKYTEAKETVAAMTVLAKMGLKKPSAYIKDPEKTAINFLNDVLVLYLIKRFWPVITSEWLPHPIRYRYEWLTVFYLFYLLVRSRMPEKS